MALIFGFLGAAVGVAYVIVVDPSHFPANAIWSIWAPEFLVYAAAGFLIGWVVGFAISKVGHHDL